MRRLILIAVMSALVLAKPKPDTYKETEDFQYSRSSSDDGTKSGFYGAQRGNTGGNYERAHNMDNLAQHQMSGLVRQVDGELGDGAKTRTGSVFTAANSRGIYGSGNYDLSNLKGRNFAEGQSIRDSQSHLSSASQNLRYGGQSYNGVTSNSGFSSSHAQHSRHSGYQTSSHADQSHVDNLQAIDASQDLGRYESGNQAGYDMKYHTQYGSRGRSDFDQSSANLYSSSGHDANSQAQYITTPVRVVVRPGGRVAIPITAPTYSVSQHALSENKNALNTDAELLGQQSVFTPTNKVKQYEASYSYRKQWEKHHELPGYVSVAVPTENPFPKISELHKDAESLQSSKNQFQDANSLLTQSSNMNRNYRGYITSTGLSQSRHQAGYNTQQGQSAVDSQQTQDGFSSPQGQSAFNLQQNQAGRNSQESHSGLSAQQSHSGLSSLQHQSGLSSQQWHSGSEQSHLGFNEQQSGASSAASGGYANAYGRSAQTSGLGTGLTNTVDDGNLKPKSYHSSYSYHKSWERQGDPYIIKPAGSTYEAQTSGKLTAASSNNGAYSNSQYGSHSRQAHQSYSADCEDEGHRRVARSANSYPQLEQGQNQWEDLGQQTQSKWEKLEDFGQQQQNKWDNLQDLGQQTQTQWDNLQQLGQETQNNWDNLQQLGQQTQDQWDKLEDLGQQTHRDLKQKSENLEDFGEHIQNGGVLTNFEQQADSQNENMDIFNQKSEKENSLTNFEQKANTQSENWDIFSQQSQNEDSLVNFEQASSQNGDLDIFSQHSQKEEPLNNFEQQAFSESEKRDIFNQKSESDLLTNFEQKANTQSENWDIFNQQRKKEDSLSNFEQQANQHSDIFNQHSQNEEVLTNFEQQANNEELYFQKTNVQQESLSNFNWNQVSGFPVPSNPDFINQEVHSANKLNSDGIDFVQTQQNQWFHPIINGFDTEKNTDRKIDDNISSQQHITDKSVNDKINLFIMSSTNNEPRPLNTEQDTSINTNGHFEHSFWNLNNFNKFEHQFENSFTHSTSTTSDNGNPLESLWDKIDNIAGDIPVNESKTEDKKIILVDNYSNFISHNQNFNHMSNGVSWSNNPVNPYIDVPNTKNDTESEDENSGQKKLFDEPSESSSTLIPKLSINHSTRPVEDIGMPINDTYVQRPYQSNQNVNSQDEGRGDIGPEETIFEPTTSDETKNQQEIEPSILNKAEIPVSQTTSMENKGEYKGNGSSELNSNQEQNTNEQTVQLLIPTTTPTIEISTIMKINTNVDSSQTLNKPILDVLNLNNNPLPDLQKHMPHQQTVQSAIPFPTEITPNDLQDIYELQNMDQIVEDFQTSKNMVEQTALQDFVQQSQSSFSSLDNLQRKDVEGNLQQVPDDQMLSTISSDKQKPQISTDSKDSRVQAQEVVEPSQIRQIQQMQNNKKEEDLKSESFPSPVEVTSEKPGIWKSIGNKLSNAKSKVFSWFQKS